MKFGPMMDDPLAIYHGNVTGRKAELLSGWGSIASPAMLLIRYTVHKHFDARGNSYTFGQQTMDSQQQISLGPYTVVENPYKIVSFLQNIAQNRSIKQLTNFCPQYC